MSALGDLIVRVGADISGFSAAMSDVSSQLSDVAESCDAAFGKIEDAGRRLAVTGATLSAAITLPLEEIGRSAIETAAQFEQTQIAFNTLVGSVKGAQAELSQLYSFAAKTPFQINGILQASRQLMALGFESKQVVPMLRTLGNAASALGGGQPLLERLVYHMGQIQSLGYLDGRVLREMGQNGIAAGQMLAQGLGVPVQKVLEMVHHKAIDAHTAIQILLSGMDKRFGGMMEQQMTTLSGQWTNLKDNITFTLVAIGNELLPMAKSFVAWSNTALASVRRVAEEFGRLSPAMKAATIGTIAFVAALGPLLTVTGGLLFALPQIATGFVMVGTAARAFAGATGAVAFAVSNGLTGALSGGELMLLRFGQAALVAAAAFAGWKIGSWINSFTDYGKQVKKAEDGTRDAIAAQTFAANKKAEAEQRQIKASHDAMDAAIKEAAAGMKAAAAQEEAAKAATKHEAALRKLEAAHRKAEAAMEANEKLCDKIRNQQESLETSTARLANEFVRSNNEMKEAGLSAIEVTVPLWQRLDVFVNAAIQKMAAVNAAYKLLGITSTATLQKAAVDAESAYEKIKDSGVASAHDVLEAQVHATEAQVTAMKAAGQDATVLEKQLEKLKQQLATFGQPTQQSGGIFGSFKTSFALIQTSFQGTIDRMLDGTLRFKRAWAVLGQDLLRSFTINLVHMGAEWLGFLAKKLALHLITNAGIVNSDEVTAGQQNAISMTRHLKEVLMAAKQAAVRTYAAVSALPFPVGVILAPIAAAGAFAGVMALGAVSAEHGAVLPNRNTVAFLHPEEMVLPRHISQGLQGMIAAGATHGSSFTMGDMHVHAAPGMNAEHLANTVISKINSRIRNNHGRLA